MKTLLFIIFMLNGIWISPHLYFIVKLWVRVIGAI